jgi:hypothetical protein
MLVFTLRMLRQKALFNHQRKGGSLIKHYFLSRVMMLPIFWLKFGGER